MDATKREALEAAAWKFGDAADFMEMSDEERRLLDARVAQVYRKNAVVSGPKSQAGQPTPFVAPADAP